ncbi:heparan-alpha-glucosaminide N-acetyltransferase [Colwellia sp. E2M01]|uniref:heparan-alpha-glucosaminide N-acetyltransferase n=1 Tax=Colwellia sp. E2M01 TaxID=2841561 RepID=UPI001C0806A3|nr:heparan-alpha-glucosaminide N-acetyltransferase [Colwellia sp. E2M01]MBU2871681.1 DUF1624 domain-containing protein [Colwellia sp. E2M01]
MIVKKRNYNVDLIRSIAILLMVIFHFFYDLKFFGWVDWYAYDNQGWKNFRCVILTLFFICVGVGLVYSHGRKINWQSFTKRLVKIAIGAGVITTISLVMFPQRWVFFGVLQFIFVGSLCAVWFASSPKLSLIIGSVIILIGNLGGVERHWPFVYIKEYLPDYSLDYIAIFPWLGVIFVGIFLGHSKYLSYDIFQLNNLKNDKLMQGLVWPGKHSLVIYLVHQPILFAVLTPFHWWLG